MMHMQMIKLIDPNCIVVAIAQVVADGEGYRGRIDLSLMPAKLQEQFAEYEEIVNGQMFSLLDEVEEQIRVLRLKIRFDTGYEVEAEDLQIYPSTNRISFKLVEEPSQSAVEEPVAV
jgi:uncharacterized protein YlaN (UPF0358 family)